MFNEFSGWQYLLIDVANNYGLDKHEFHERIEWANANLHQLEDLAEDVKAKKRPLYIKACMNIRRAQAQRAQGCMVALDASCSGLQVMSALTGCITGATNTGLIDPTKPMDAYSICTGYMNEDLGGFSIPRDDAKTAFMTMLYGSSEEPKKIFGEGTPELSAFYGAAEKTGPGAYELLQELLAAWQPMALVHEWTLPDGFHARVRVKTKKETRITVDELGKASFTYQYSEYEGTKTGISLPANTVHSVDAYVLRCMHRRCNYDKGVAEQALALIETELQAREDGGYQYGTPADKVQYYIDLYDRTGIADVVILPYLVKHNDCVTLSTEHLQQLSSIILSMLQHKPFPVITIHDSFAAHPNNLNQLRKHYINIMAELAESNLLTSIMNEITGNTDGVYEKKSENLGQLIRGGQYAIS